MMVSYEGQCHLIFWRNEKPVTKASSKHFLKPYKKNFILKDKQNEVHPAHLKIKGDLLHCFYSNYLSHGTSQSFFLTRDWKSFYMRAY